MLFNFYKVPAFFFLLLASCTNSIIQDAPKATLDLKKRDFGSILGKSPILLKGKKQQSRYTSSDITNVNKFLWEGAIETVGFMPIITANPQKGIISTDWYLSEDQPNIRVKVAINITGKELRADAVKVFVERQKRKQNNTWINYSLPKQSAVQLEILITEKARKLRNSLIRR